MFGKTEEKTNFSGGVGASSSFDAGDVAGGDSSCHKKINKTLQFMISMY